MAEERARPRQAQRTIVDDGAGREDAAGAAAAPTVPLTLDVDTVLDLIFEAARASAVAYGLSHPDDIASSVVTAAENVGAALGAVYRRARTAEQ